ADLRGADDEDCIKAMLSICDARFIPKLLDKAKRELKLTGSFEAPTSWTQNRPEHIAAVLAPYRKNNLLPEYPLGCDFTPVELRLVKALGFLKSKTASTFGKIKLIAMSLISPSTPDIEAMQRMDLQSPGSMKEKLAARLVSYALKVAK
ncbi:MAG TPA: acetyl-CoA hydrolase, partial [Arenimonas sp.]|nr:acetyl-CoA hydrolase [Arenimonas sp.]